MSLSLSAAARQGRADRPCIGCADHDLPRLGAARRRAAQGLRAPARRNRRPGPRARRDDPSSALPERGDAGTAPHRRDGLRKDHCSAQGRPRHPRPQSSLLDRAVEIGRRHGAGRRRAVGIGGAGNGAPSRRLSSLCDHRRPARHRDRGPHTRPPVGHARNHRRPRRFLDYRQRQPRDDARMHQAGQGCSASAPRAHVVAPSSSSQRRPCMVGTWMRLHRQPGSAGSPKGS